MSPYLNLRFRSRCLRFLSACALVGTLPLVPMGHAASAATCPARHATPQWVVIDSPFTTPVIEPVAGDSRSLFDRDGSLNLVAVDPLDPSRIFATDGTQVDRSTDGGCTWTPVYSTGVEGSDQPAPYVISRIAISGSGQFSHIYLLLQENLASRSASYDDQVVASTNGGASFASHDLTTPNISRPQPACPTAGQADEYTLNLATSMSSPTTVYFLCDGTSPLLWVSTDSATTWRQVPSAGLPYWTAYSPFTVAMTSVKSLWLAGRNGGAPFETGVWRSIDGGRTFTEVYKFASTTMSVTNNAQTGLQTYLPAHAKPAALEVLTANEAALALSTNAGRSWTSVPLPPMPSGRTGPLLSAAFGPKPGEVTAVTGYGNSGGYVSSSGPSATPACGESTLAWSYSIAKRKWTPLTSPSLGNLGGYAIYGLAPGGVGSAAGVYGLETGFNSPCSSSLAVESANIVAYTGS